MRFHPLRLALPLLTAFVLTVPAQATTTLKEPFAQSYPFAAGSTLSLKNINGSVTIDAWDKGEARIEAEKEVKASSGAEAKKLMGQVKIDVQQSSGGLRVETRLPKREDDGWFSWLGGSHGNITVRYHLYLPRAAAVTVNNTNGHVQVTGTHGKAALETTNGALEVAGVEGDLDLETTNGHIKANGITGTVKAETTNGGVDLIFAQVPRAGDLQVETTNGAVTVKLPRGSAVSVDAETSNGGVHSDFAIAGETGKHRVNGTINGGGSRLRIRTTNGGVHLVES